VNQGGGRQTRHDTDQLIHSSDPLAGDVGFPLSAADRPITLESLDPGV
jgi:hypothetical protein